METEERDIAQQMRGTFQEVRANVLRQRGVAIDEAEVDIDALNRVLANTPPPSNTLYGIEPMRRVNWGVDPASGPQVQTVSYIDPATGNLVQSPQPVPMAATIPVQPAVPTTKEYLLQFFEAFHSRPPSDLDIIFIDALSLDDKNLAKEAIANYELPLIHSPDDLIDLPDRGGALSIHEQQIMNEINHHEAMLSDARNRLRMEFEVVPLPSISLVRIKEDFSDFWDVNINGNMEIDLTCKFDCKLTHTFKERPDGTERRITVNLGKYKFRFHLENLGFIQCIPQHFRVRDGSGITAAHPHVSGHICWGTQSEVAQDAIVRKDFKKFSTLLFQAINNYNHSSTFCSLLKYKIVLRDYEGETISFRAGTSYRNMRLNQLPKGIHLSSVYSTDGRDARVLVYRRYMPYLNDYIQGNYFKVSKTINEMGFIADDRDPATNNPTYQVVDEAEMARIVEKRGPDTGIDQEGPS